MLHVLILVRVLNLHVGPRLGVILDIFVDLDHLRWKGKRSKQILKFNHTDVMGGLHWPLSAFL